MAPLKAFSDVHGAPAQRYYNLLCLAYGAEPTVFADVVAKGYLPKEGPSVANANTIRLRMGFESS